MAVPASNKGKMKKLQRKSKFQLEKLAELRQLEEKVNDAVQLMLQRRGEWQVISRVLRRARVLEHDAGDREILWATEEDARLMDSMKGRELMWMLQQLREAVRLVEGLGKEWRDDTGTIG